jgi:hypothetical protein
MYYETMKGKGIAIVEAIHRKSMTTGKALQRTSFPAGFSTLRLVPVLNSGIRGLQSRVLICDSGREGETTWHGLKN